MLKRWGSGDRAVLDELVPVVYEELKRMARARLRAVPPGQTLDTTGLVHEAFLRMVDIEQVSWADRGHFWSVAARVMRNILVDAARRRTARKRGGAFRKVDLEEEWLLLPEPESERLLALDEALSRLEVGHPRVARAVELHYFVGLTQEEVGGVLDVSQPTVARDLRFARAWLAMKGDLGSTA